MDLDQTYERAFFRIGEVARMAGMTAETVRFYEDKGLIECAKRSETGYRLFDAGTVKQLQDIRFYRSLGIPIQDIVTLLQSPDTGTLARILNAREQSVHADIERCRLLLERIRSMRKRETARPGEYTLQWHPTYYKILCARGKEPRFDLRCGLPEEVMQNYFFAFYGGFFARVRVEKGAPVMEDFAEGFSVDPFLVNQLGLSGEALDDYVPGCLCVNTGIAVSGSVQPDCLAGVFDWMARQNLEPTGLVWGKTLASYREAGVWRRFYDIWVPIVPPKDSKGAQI